MLTINGIAHRVVMSSVPLRSKNRRVDLLGFISGRDDVIMIDGTLKKDRQGEVLLHELIHAADDMLFEDSVRRLGENLFGILSANNLIPRNFVAKAVDGMATKAEESAALERLQLQEDLVEQAPTLILAGREMGEGVAARSNSPAATGGAGGDVLTSAGSGETEPEGVMPGDGSGDGDANPAGGAGGSGNETALRNTLGALRSEVRVLKERNATLAARSDKLTELEDAEKTEVERLGDENAAQAEEIERLMASNVETSKRSAFMTAAVQAGVINPDSAYRILDPALLGVDQGGSVTGVAEAVESLKGTDSYLFQSGKAAGGSSTNASASGDPPEPEPLTAEQRAATRALLGNDF